MPLLRPPVRKYRPSPFQEELRTPGPMRPARSRVVGTIIHAGGTEAISPHESCVNLGRRCEAAAVSQRLGNSCFRSSVIADDRAVNSLREQEDRLRKKFARQLVVLGRGVAAESAVLSSLADRRDDQLEFLFLDRAPTTLRRHVGTWRKWLEFCAAVSSCPGNPGLCLLLDFLDALSMGAQSDRGRGRRGRAVSVVSSLRFVAAKLEILPLSTMLNSSSVCSWTGADKWSRMPCKEALPLSLGIVIALEKAAAAADDRDAWPLLCILLMIWAGLRWSDCQRTDFQSVVVDKTSVRAWCWRSKTSAVGIPWGVLLDGASGLGWGGRLGRLMLQVSEQDKKRDFFMCRNNAPMCYSSMLAIFRRCLIGYGGLSPSEAVRYTLHSCKVTTLSWANQLDSDAQLKAAQGHHATVEVGKSVRKYRRDDVLPQLNCQHRLLGAIGKGWRPVTPLQRGVVILDDAQGFVPTCNADADTEPEVSGDEVEQLADDCPVQAFDGVAPSDGEEDAEGTASSGSEECLASADELDCDSEDGSNYVGPWIVNLSSGLFHKACEDPCGHKGFSWRGKSWRRACGMQTVGSVMRPLCYY